MTPGLPRGSEAFVRRFAARLLADHPVLSHVLEAQLRHARVVAVEASPAGAFIELHAAEARRAGIARITGRRLDGFMLRDARAPDATIGSILWLDDGYASAIEIWASDGWSCDLCALSLVP